MRKHTPRQQPTTTPSYTPLIETVTTHKRLDAMTHDEGRAWLQGLRERLQHKMQRERDCLDRRAAQRTHTSTDEAYENDQRLEAELLSLIVSLEQGLTEREGNI